MTAAEVARAFVDAINHGDVERLGSLITDDHRFVDSMGTEYRGRDAMCSGWKRYFAMVPDYRIEVQESCEHGPVVHMVGRAHGTFAHEGRLDAADRWSVPAAWRAVVTGNQVASWHVFADNEPMRRAMRRHGHESA